MQECRRGEGGHLQKVIHKNRWLF